MSLFGPRFLKWNNCILIKKRHGVAWRFYGTVSERACSHHAVQSIVKTMDFLSFHHFAGNWNIWYVYEWMVLGFVVVSPRNRYRFDWYWSIWGDNCFPYDFYKSTDGLIRIMRTSVAFSLRILRRLSCLVQDLELKFMAWTWHPFHSYRAHPGIRAKWHVLKYNLSHLPGVSLEAWKLKILRFFLTPIHAFL